MQPWTEGCVSVDQEERVLIRFVAPHWLESLAYIARALTDTDLIDAPRLRARRVTISADICADHEGELICLSSSCARCARV